MTGYRATRDADGVLTVHRVPIFVECTRGDFTADAAWLSKAVRRAHEAAVDGYYPPLHIRHHDDESDVRAAGYFKVLGTETITFKGARRVAVLADLVVTDLCAQSDVLAKRLPYRSVEIFDVDVPGLDSLALLDHQAPYLELPMLMVSDVEDPAPESSSIRGIDTAIPGAVAGLVRVAYAKIKSPWQNGSPAAGEPVVACFRRGHSAYLFFEDDDPMAPPIKTPAKPNVVPPKTSIQMADDGPPKKDDDKKDDDKGDGEKMADEGLDVSAVVKAIGDGSISVADMDAIMDAIQAQQGTAAPDAEDAATSPPAPAAAPGESMTKGPMSAAMAKMQGKLDAQTARLDERDASDVRRDDVALALQRLEGQPLGSDLEAKLVKFHADHGGAAFKSYVDSLVQTFAAYAGGGDATAEAFAGSTTGVPAEALAYQDKGTDAVEKAAQFAREHAELEARGHVRMSAKRYVELNMAKAV